MNLSIAKGQKLLKKANPKIKHKVFLAFLNYCISLEFILLLLRTFRPRLGLRIWRVLFLQLHNRDLLHISLILIRRNRTYDFHAYFLFFLLPAILRLLRYSFFLIWITQGNFFDLEVDIIHFIVRGRRIMSIFIQFIVKNGGPSCPHPENRWIILMACRPLRRVWDENTAVSDFYTLFWVWRFFTHAWFM